MEINRVVQNQQANFWQWQGVDYAVFCQTEPICEFTDTAENVEVSGYSDATLPTCVDSGDKTKYPFKAGDEFGITVPLSVLGLVSLTEIRLGISVFGVAQYFDVATVKILNDVVWFSGTLPNRLTNGNYEFFIYTDSGSLITLDFLQKVNNLVDTDCLGLIEVTANGGTAPYEYSIDGVNYTDSGLFENLCNGVYTVWVRDANCQGNVLVTEIRTFPGCEFFADKSLEYLCANGWQIIDLCDCTINC